MDIIFDLHVTMTEMIGIWVIMEKFTKLAYFLSLKMKWSVTKFVDLFVREIIRLHGVPKYIVSDHDLRFISKFLKNFQNALCVEVRSSFTYQPQTYS